jgi:hypothetical protein
MLKTREANVCQNVSTSDKRELKVMPTISQLVRKPREVSVSKSKSPFF